MFEGWHGSPGGEVRMPGFTHLHTVSGFSLRYGASHPERLAERAAERGMDALALTDRDTLAGAVRFAKACAAQAGVRPLFGADLAVAGGTSRGDRPGGAAPDPGARRRLHRRVDAPRSSSPGTARRAGPTCAGSSPPPTPGGRSGLPLLPWAGQPRRRPDRPARARLRGRPRARRRPPRPGRQTARALAGGLRRRPAPGSRLPRPRGHRPRLPAAGRPYPRLRRRAAGAGRAHQRRPLRRPGHGPGRRRPGRRPPARARRPPQGAGQRRALAQGRGRHDRRRRADRRGRRATGATPRTGCSNRPRRPPPSAWSTPRTTSASAPCTSPSRTSSAPDRRTAQRVLASRAAAGMVLRGYDRSPERVATGSGCTTSWTSSPTTASPPTS